jgi:hypothetical protein
MIFALSVFIAHKGIERMLLARQRRGIDLPFFREQIYHALTSQDAAQWADLGTYRA